MGAAGRDAQHADGAREDVSEAVSHGCPDTARRKPGLSGGGLLGRGQPDVVPEEPARRHRVLAGFSSSFDEVGEKFRTGLLARKPADQENLLRELQLGHRGYRPGSRRQFDPMQASGNRGRSRHRARRVGHAEHRQRRFVRFGGILGHTLKLRLGRRGTACRWDQVVQRAIVVRLNQDARPKSGISQSSPSSGS